MQVLSNAKPRIGRSRYWLHFLICLVVGIALVVGAVTAFFSGSFGLAIVLLLPLLATGIWFRIVMMRRCRDVGWPPALPWIFFAALILTSGAGFGAISTGDPTALFASTGLSWLVQIGDFVLVMILGFKRGIGAPDYRTVFGDGPDEARDNDGDADDAIARALENYRRTGSAVPQQSRPAKTARRSVPQKAPQPVMQAGGFGRKGLR